MLNKMEPVFMWSQIFNWLNYSLYIKFNQNEHLHSCSEICKKQHFMCNANIRGHFSDTIHSIQTFIVLVTEYMK